MNILNRPDLVFAISVGLEFDAPTVVGRDGVGSKAMSDQDGTSNRTNKRPRREPGRQRFWKTLPGIITATAGLISAVAALVGGLIAAGIIGGSHTNVALSSGHVTTSSSGGGNSGGAGNSGGSSSGGSGGSGTGGAGGGGSSDSGGGSSTGGSSGGGSSTGGSGGSGNSNGGSCTIIASSDASALQGTYLFDFDSGTETTTGADVWWDQQTDIVRSLAPQSGATIVNLGSVDFGSLTCGELRSETYASAPIDGNNDATNLLTTGDVFAVRTDQGNYAKVQVLSYGYDLELKFVTYQGS